MKSKELSSEEILMINERCMAATPGPWKCPDEKNVLINTVVATGEYARLNVIAHTHVSPNREITVEDAHRNAIFIAHARMDIPSLVAEVQRLRSERIYMQSVIDSAMDYLHTDRTPGAAGQRLLQVADELVKFRSSLE